MKNGNIRTEISGSGYKHWQIAEEIGIHETTLTRWLRVTLTPEKKTIIREAICRLNKKRLEEYEEVLRNDKSRRKAE